MKTENSNLLTLSYNLNKGFVLNWNFKGSISNNQMYFKHILILDHKNTEFLQEFVNEYYKRIKYGDLICLIKSDSGRNSNLLSWKEKSMGKQLKLKKIASCFSSQEDIISKLNELRQQLLQYEEPIIINILTDKKDIKKTYQQVLSIRKSFKTFDFIVSFFGDFPNDISYTSGLNILYYTPFSSQKLLNFYHNKYISRIQYSYVKVTITCQNGQINCQKSDDWESPEFNILSKKFYAPHSDYSYDSLFMIHQDGIENITYQLTINIQYQTFGKRKFQSTKKISINLQNQKIYLRTFGQRQPTYESQIEPGIWIKKNVYSSNYFVWFKKQKRQQSEV